jgi:hypothetical protein
MNRYIMQQMAANRATDLQKQAAAARRARLVRRARRDDMIAQHGI